MLITPIAPKASVTNPTGFVYSEPHDFRPGMVHQFNLNVQRQLPGTVVLTVGYAGTRSAHQQTLNWNLDTATPGPGIDPPNRRPYPNLTYINAILSRGQGRYDSLQVRAEKQTSHGLYFLVAYTYSKAFDNGLYDDLGSLVGVPYFPLYVPGNPDKGLSIIDQTHNFTASALYQLPFGAGKQFDRENILGKIDNRSQLERTRHAHGNVVLFAAARPPDQADPAFSEQLRRWNAEQGITINEKSNLDKSEVERMLAEAGVQDAGDLVREALRAVRGRPSLPHPFDQMLLDDADQLNPASAALVPGMTTTNSSPPTRERVSETRMLARSVAATAWRARSPVPCPKASFRRLNRSTSIMSSETSGGGVVCRRPRRWRVKYRRL